MKNKSGKARRGTRLKAKDLASRKAPKGGVTGPCNTTLRVGVTGPCNKTLRKTLGGGVVAPGG
jgi:hypothetical protein